MKHRRLFCFSAWSPKITTYYGKKVYTSVVISFRREPEWYRDREVWYGMHEKIEIKKYLSYYNMTHYQE